MTDTKVRMLPLEGTVGTTGTFALEVTLGEEPLHAGGRLRIAPFRKVANYWVPVQTKFPSRENYVSLRTPPDARCQLDVKDRGWSIAATVIEGELAPGDKVVFVFGDASSGSPGLCLAGLAGRAEFRVYLRTDANSEEREVATAFFDILPAEPNKLLVRARKQPGRNSILLRAAAVDAFGNTVTDAPCSLRPEPVVGAELTQPLRFPDSGKALRQAEMRVTDDFSGERIHVAADELGLTTRADPVSMDRQIFWGDLHGHTRLAQALDTPEFLYDYAKDDAALDFLCHVEHYCAADSDRWIGDEWRRWHTRPADLAAYIRDCWAYQNELVRQHHEPGRFVPFLGFEWASNIYGHMNVIYASGEGEVIFPQSFWSKTDTPETLYERLSGVEALVIPHHPSWPVNNGRNVSGVDWRYCDPRLTRLVEICSKHGVSEYLGCPDAPHSQARDGTVQTALAMGHRLGFVGSTDTHASRPGSWGIPGDLWARRGGLTAVFAETLDRASVYAALKNRRCYATTGARLVLDFSVNGQPMGSEIDCPSRAERLVKGVVMGTAGIRHVELVRNGGVIYRHKPVGQDEAARFEFVDRAAMAGETCYYMRVMQTDGHQAWASPVWVTRKE